MQRRNIKYPETVGHSRRQLFGILSAQLGSPVPQGLGSHNVPAKPQTLTIIIDDLVDMISACHSLF
jgi:hypothetical protein